MKYLILFILFSIQLYPQPGGGGGLKINRIFDNNLKEINKKELVIEMTLLDSCLTLLSKTKIKQNTSIYLSPLNNYSYSSKNRGLLIQYKNTNYRIDFENIIPENGGGYIENIDSLVLFKPYILSKRSYEHISHSAGEFQEYLLLRDLSSSYLKNGITPDSYKQLSNFDLIFDAPSFAYNQQPKKWMNAYKNLYHDYRQHNYSHSNEEIKSFINRLDSLIKKYKLIPPFAFFKILLLHQLNKYSEIILLYEKQSFKYPQYLYFMNNILILAYEQNKDYKKAISLSNSLAENFKENNKDRYYQYLFKSLFIKSYYQNKDVSKELKEIIDNEKHPNYYRNELDRLKILKVFNTYKFKNKLKGRLQIKLYDKELIPSEIKKVMKIL